MSDNILLPEHAAPFFGPDVNGEWGGVPWGDAFRKAPGVTLLADDRPWQDQIVVFTTPDGARNVVVLVTADVDCDTDGPGGSTEVDPCWQPTTSLRWPDGASVNSREFRGMVMHELMERHGAATGDIGLSVWGGIAHFHQYYDVGPRDKSQEASIKLLRDHGVVTPEQSDRHAAVDGNDVTDFCALVFVGSAPRDLDGDAYALPQDELIALGWQLWHDFTNRPSPGPNGAAVGVSGVSSAAAPMPSPAVPGVGTAGTASTGEAA